MIKKSIALVVAQLFFIDLSLYYHLAIVDPPL